MTAFGCGGAGNQHGHQGLGDRLARVRRRIAQDLQGVHGLGQGRRDVACCEAGDGVGVVADPGLQGEEPPPLVFGVQAVPAGRPEDAPDHDGVLVRGGYPEGMGMVPGSATSGPFDIDVAGAQRVRADLPLGPVPLDWPLMTRPYGPDCR